VGARSTLVGKNLIDSHLRQNYGVIIVAIKKISGEMIYNPLPSEKLDAGDVIVVIGKKEDLKRMSEIM
jgi:voltage-gated potassium channel